MATLRKYHPTGEVLAAEATESNLDDLASMAGATTFTSPQGDRYALVESPSGTTRLDVGGWLVQDGDGKRATFRALSADEFAASFTK